MTSTLATNGGRAAPADPTAGVLGFVTAELERASQRRRGVVVTVPAPRAPLEALFCQAADEPATLWRPPDGTAFATAGVCEEVAARGPDRFEAIRARASEAWAGYDAATPGPKTDPPVTFVGGFAFHPGSAGQHPWTGFGDASFQLPRLRYARRGQEAWLSLAASADSLRDRKARAALIDRLARALDALAHVRPPLERLDARVSRLETTDRAAWREQIESIRRAILGGQVEKVVAARRALLTLDRPIDVVSVLRRLADDAPRCTTFAFRMGSATFLGATPERLVARRGQRVETEALAGSIGSSDDAARLLASTKDHSEHAFVVREIVRALEPVCRSVTFGDTPEIRAFKHVSHLCTPIDAELEGQRHVLDLVRRLHPTPAVGGVPRERAIDWIVENEPTPRGWYAGPVGWFDVAGNGEFSVALRSGLLVGACAHLFAGSGIVRDSEPEAEYAETDLKLESLLAALRATP